MRLKVNDTVKDPSGSGTARVVRIVGEYEGSRGPENTVVLRDSSGHEWQADSEDCDRA